MLASDLAKPSAPAKRRHYVLIAGLCFLSPLTDLKLADVQPIELFGLGYLAFAIVLLSINGGVVRGLREVMTLVKLHAVLLFVVAALAVVALRLEVFPPFQLPLLKEQPFLSVSRIVQLAICSGGFLMTTMAITRRPSLIPILAQLYVWAGLVSAVYALVSVAGWMVGIELPGAYSIDFIRARGFFVEGGSFGVYLVGVLLVSLYRAKVFDTSRKVTIAHVAILGVALLAAQSKSAILLAALMCGFYLLTDKRRLRLIGMATIGVPLVALYLYNAGIGGYVSGISNFESEIDSHADDTSFAMGRIMASVLVPRMIAEHPILGIGIGNYSLQRNNPQILDGLPTTDGWDLPSLGLLGYTAELGIPCTLFLILLIWKPVQFVKRRQVYPICVALAAYQLFAHLFGAQITFAYPWVVSAIALGHALTYPMGRPLLEGKRYRLVWRRTVRAKPSVPSNIVPTDR